MKYCLPLLCAFTMPALIFSADISHAQTPAISMKEREKELSVLTRENSSYDRAGIRFAGLVLHADLTSAIEYQDNLYSRDSNETADSVNKIAPSLAISSDFKRHFLSANIRVEKGIYKNNSGEDYTDYNSRIAARADILGNISIPAFIEYNKRHSKRADPEDQNELKPTLYNELILNTGVDYKGANIDFLINTNLKKITFKDNYTASAFIDNSDRNRNELLISANVGFAKNRMISPFIFADLQKIKYDRKIDDNGLQRSSSSFIGGLGLNIAPSSSLLSAKIRIGMVDRSFDENSFSDINALIYSAKLSWEPSTLLALNLAGEREINEAIFNNFSASVDDIISASAYYELAPNIFLNPKASYLVKNYRGDVSRKLKQTAGEMNIIYKINRNIWLSGAYNYIKQSENENGLNLRTFDNNLYNISMKLQI